VSVPNQDTTEASFQMVHVLATDREIIFLCLSQLQLITLDTYEARMSLCLPASLKKNRDKC
jgi:hypothetical protein